MAIFELFDYSSEDFWLTHLLRYACTLLYCNLLKAQKQIV